MAKDKREKFVIIRGQYGCATGRYVCVIENMAKFKILMMKCNYTYDSERMRFHNDTTRIWYGVFSVEIIPDEEIFRFFGRKYLDIADAKNYKRAILSSTQAIPRIRRKTAMKNFDCYV